MVRADREAVTHKAATPLPSHNPHLCEHGDETPAEVGQPLAVEGGRIVNDEGEWVRCLMKYSAVQCMGIIIKRSLPFNCSSM